MLCGRDGREGGDRSSSGLREGDDDDEDGDDDGEQTQEQMQ